MQKLLKLQKIFLAQFVALNQIYNMEFRAKLYLKYQARSTRSKSKGTLRTENLELGTEN